MYKDGRDKVTKLIQLLEQEGLKKDDYKAYPIAKEEDIAELLYLRNINGYEVCLFPNYRDGKIEVSFDLNPEGYDYCLLDQSCTQEDAELFNQTRLDTLKKVGVELVMKSTDISELNIEDRAREVLLTLGKINALFYTDEGESVFCANLEIYKKAREAKNLLARLNETLYGKINKFLIFVSEV